MLVWLILLIAEHSCRPVAIISMTMLNETRLTNDFNSTKSLYKGEGTINGLLNPTKKLIDPSIYITVRENDWRDNHESRMIIWSIESHHHPDYGRSYSKGTPQSQRLTRNSQLMSFMILGSVIGFILYTYLSHVLMMRRLHKEMKATRLRELVRRSAMIMAGSAQHNGVDLNARRLSLINMFKGFKL